MKQVVLEKITTLVIAAFGLVAALAWNDAIKALFKSIFGESSGIIAMFVYAILVTAIAVFVTLKLGKAEGK
mgnify:CR=1 FL=1